MTTKPRNIINPQLLTTDIEVLYTNQPLEITILKKLGFFNAGDTPCEIFVYLVKQGSSPSVANQIAQERIAAKQRYEYIGIGEDVLEEGDTIQANVSTGGICNIRGSANIRVENRLAF